LKRSRFWKSARSSRLCMCSSMRSGRDEVLSPWAQHSVGSHSTLNPRLVLALHWCCLKLGSTNLWRRQRATRKASQPCSKPDLSKHSLPKTGKRANSTATA
jgi:hypothetical protein